MSESEHIFFSDLKFSGQYYAVLVRSPVQCGRLSEIKPPELPEGYFLFTAADIPGKNSVEINGGSVPVFAEGVVSYIGEPVGIIAGPNCETAALLAEKTEVLIERSESASENFTENLLATNAHCVIKQTAQKGDSSLFFHKENNGGGYTDSDSTPKNQDNAENEKTENNADKSENNPQEESSLGDPLSDSTDNIKQETKENNSLIITESYVEISSAEYFYAEHSGAVARYKKDHLEVYTATLWPFHVKKTVSAVLALSPEKIAVTPTDLGANHDGRILEPSLAAAQATLAAFLCKKPVKLIFSRSEEFSYYSKTPPARIRIKSAAAPDGKIKAMETDIEINPGSRTPFIGEITARMILASQSFYNIENSRTSFKYPETNLPPMIPANGFGESYVFSALETHMDILSQQLGILPCDVRQANIADKKYSPIIETICEKSGFSRKYTAYENLNQKRSGIKDGPVRGIGLSLGYQGSGFLSEWQEGIQYSVEMTMETTGEIHIKSGAFSPSIKEIICKITADFLDIDKDLISFTDTASDNLSFNGPDILSSSIAIIAPLVSKCCSVIQRQRFRKPLPITVKKTYKPAKPHNAKADGNLNMLQDAAFVSFTPGACVVELELNPLNWSIKTRGIWIVCSAGKLLDTHAAENTLKRTVKESLAKLSCEAIKIEDGRLCRTERFGCSIPAFFPAPDAEICFIDSKEIPCGLGTIAHNLLPGAYCSAITQITRKAEIKIPMDTKYLYNCFADITDGAAQ